MIWGLFLDIMLQGLIYGRRIINVATNNNIGRNGSGTCGPRAYPVRVFPLSAFITNGTIATRFCTNKRTVQCQTLCRPDSSQPIVSPVSIAATAANDIDMMNGGYSQGRMAVGQRRNRKSIE